MGMVERVAHRIGWLLINVSLALWRTDIDFKEWPFGPPQHGMRYGLAWRLYHLGLRLAMIDKALESGE